MLVPLGEAISLDVYATPDCGSVYAQLVAVTLVPGLPLPPVSTVFTTSLWTVASRALTRRTMYAVSWICPPPAVTVGASAPGEDGPAEPPVVASTVATPAAAISGVPAAAARWAERRRAVRRASSAKPGGTSVRAV